MGRMEIINNGEKFAEVVPEVLDGALERMSGDIAQITWITIPFKGGDLQKNTEARKKGFLKHIVIIDSEYGAVQERGKRLSGRGAPTREFSNYSTPGTGKDALKKAGAQVTKDAFQYYKQANQNIRL